MFCVLAQAAPQAATWLIRWVPTSQYIAVATGMNGSGESRDNSLIIYIYKDYINDDGSIIKIISHEQAWNLINIDLLDL